MKIDRKKIASFNLNIIFLSSFYFFIIWGLIEPFSKLINHFSFFGVLESVVEIALKTLIILVMILILMVINSYFFTNTFEK